MLGADDFDQPHLAGAGKVGAAAGAAIAARFDQTHRAVNFFFAAVFGCCQRFGIGDIAAHGGVGAHGGIGSCLGLCQLGGGQRDAGVHPHIGRADVKAHVFGAEQAVQCAA